MATKSSTKKKKKQEFSKIVCIIGFITFLALGVWMIGMYYHLTILAINNDSTVTPDASLPIAGITFMFSPIISYLLYQAGLKNSRNKYGVDSDGQPFRQEINEYE